MLYSHINIVMDVFWSKYFILLIAILLGSVIVMVKLFILFKVIILEILH